jgi:hypothetical protein
MEKGFCASLCCFGWPGLLCGGLESKKLEGYCFNCGNKFDVESTIKNKWRKDEFQKWRENEDQKWQENEDQSSISKKVSGLVLLNIVITIAGFLFFFSVQDNISRLLILVFTLLLDFVILDATSKEKEKEEVDLPEIYTRNSRYSDNPKEEEGSKLSKKSKEEVSEAESNKRFMPNAQEAEEEGLNDTHMYCSKCGKKISKDAVFCKYCGNRV